MNMGAYRQFEILVETSRPVDLLLDHIITILYIHSFGDVQHTRRGVNCFFYYYYFTPPKIAIAAAS